MASWLLVVVGDERRISNSFPTPIPTRCTWFYISVYSNSKRQCRRIGTIVIHNHPSFSSFLSRTANNLDPKYDPDGAEAVRIVPQTWNPILCTAKTIMVVSTPTQTNPTRAPEAKIGERKRVLGEMQPNWQVSSPTVVVVVASDERVKSRILGELESLMIDAT